METSVPAAGELRVGHRAWRPGWRCAAVARSRRPRRVRSAWIGTTRRAQRDVRRRSLDRATRITGGPSVCAMSAVRRWRASSIRRSAQGAIRGARNQPSLITIRAGSLRRVARWQAVQSGEPRSVRGWGTRPGIAGVVGIACVGGVPRFALLEAKRRMRVLADEPSLGDEPTKRCEEDLQVDVDRFRVTGRCEACGALARHGRAIRQGEGWGRWSSRASRARPWRLPSRGVGGGAVRRHGRLRSCGPGRRALAKARDGRSPRLHAERRARSGAAMAEGSRRGHMPLLTLHQSALRIVLPRCNTPAAIHA